MLSIMGEATGIAKEKAQEILSILAGLTIEEAQDAITVAHNKLTLFSSLQRNKIIFCLPVRENL